MTQTPLRERPTRDQRIVEHGTWEQFKSIQKGFESSRRVRLFYYDGTIEILMPGQDHEIYKSIIGMLLEIYLVEREIEFWPTGSMTQEQEGEVSAQADESYCLHELKPVPDLSIEVVFTSGGPNKLARYRALGVPEVWFWQDGLFTLYELGEQDYKRIYRSRCLPDLDLELLGRCLLVTSKVQAAKEFRRAISQ